jgi:integrase
VSRHIVKEFGSRGSRRCLVIRETNGRYLVERYVGGAPKRKRYAEKPHAIAWARSWYEAGLPTSKDFTIRQLLDLYLEVEGEKKHWRRSTRLNYLNHRKRIEEALGPDLKANALGHGDLDDLWRKLTKLGMAPNQVRNKVQLLQRVYDWAHARDYVSHNKPGTWDIPEVKKRQPGEYAPVDVDKVLAAWDYEDGWEWRPWAVTMFAQSHGFRVNAILHLRWSDVDLERGVVLLREEHDKTKRGWERPLTWDAYAALLTARWHRDRLAGKWTEARTASPFVFCGKGEKPYTYAGYWLALNKAETKAGVKHEPGRAAHGFRRTAVGNVRRATGDAALALLWVGDRDLRQAPSYIKERPEEIAAIADRTVIVPGMKNGKVMQ